MLAGAMFGRRCSLQTAPRAEVKSVGEGSGASIRFAAVVSQRVGRVDALIVAIQSMCWLLGRSGNI